MSARTTVAGCRWNSQPGRATPRGEVLSGLGSCWTPILIWETQILNLAWDRLRLVSPSPAAYRPYCMSSVVPSALAPQEFARGVGRPLPDWPWWLPAAAVAGWWLADLRFQWASLPEYRFGPIVVILSAYLAWERWETRPREDTPAPLWQCLSVASFGLPLVLLAELWKYGVARAAAPTFALSIGSTLFLLALTLAVAGRRTIRHFFFPLLFFFIAVPLPNTFRQPIVSGLQSWVAILNVEILNLMGVAAKKTGNLIELSYSHTTVGVNEACSGIRSLQSSIMVALFVGDLVIRRTGWKIFFGAHVHRE